MIKLLYITNQICGPGGLERVLSIKTRYLSENLGYDITILTLNQGESSIFYEFSDKIKYLDITAKGNPLQYFTNYRTGIKKAIEEINPDIVLVCDDGIKGLLLPIIIGKAKPMIYERHVSKNIEKRKEKLPFLDQLFTKIKFKIMEYGGKQYDKFVVLTEGNKKEWNLKNLEVIPNPLSFYPEELSTLQNKKVLAVGKQSYQKGYDRLLKSWKIVNEKFPDWKLEVYGKIDPSQKLDQLAKDLKISESVSFFPPTKQISEKYKEASIYVMSSRYEGFGMVLTEAMAYGVPCVSFNCPYGPSDIIANREDGLLVENDDIKKLGQSIIQLIENKELRIQMGQKARKSVKRYLPEKIAEQWDQLFSDILHNSSL